VLLERDDLLATLDTFLTDAHRGRGRLVLVAGEAGVGKSSLVQALAGDAHGSRVLFGVCDGAAPARPLGPLVDIADALRMTISDQLRGSSARFGLFQQVRAGLVATPTMFVIEDLHWADEATLDFVRYLGRRLQDQSLLVVATYRDEGNDALTAVLGDLSTCSTTTRLRIPPLTVEAIQQWVARAGSPLTPLPCTTAPAATRSSSVKCSAVVAKRFRRACGTRCWPES
jgi:predicted ATPase